MMGKFLTILAAGVVGGLAASAAMNLYQRAAAPAFGQGGSNEDPATVKAADDAKQVVGAPPVAQKRRAEAGGVVHYAFGAALGVGYVALADRWSPATAGFGAAFGVAVALVADDVAVPALGWGPWPTEVGAGSHAYGISSHIVFGVVLEGVRRLAVPLLD